MAVPAVLGCHPLIGWRALQSWASVGLFQLSTKGAERRQNQLGGFKKAERAERVNATGGINENDISLWKREDFKHLEQLMLLIRVRRFRVVGLRDRRMQKCPLIVCH